MISPLDTVRLVDNESDVVSNQRPAAARTLDDNPARVVSIGPEPGEWLPALDFTVSKLHERNAVCILEIRGHHCGKRIATGLACVKRANDGGRRRFNILATRNALIIAPRGRPGLIALADRPASRRPLG